MNPTIKDVARLANTSKSTVSRYLNGQSVNNKTEKLLESAIKELDYHPNVNARRLVQDRTQEIGIIVDDISNNFYSGILRGIEQVTNQYGYRCVYYSGTSNYQGEIDYLNLVQKRQVDGLILISFLKRSPKLLKKISEIKIPIVLVGDNGNLNTIDSIDVDNEVGITQLGRYLHRIGHKKVAFIGGPEGFAATKGRTQGFKRVLEELKLEYKPEWVVSSDWSKEGGFKALKQLLKIGGFTAVIASNDETAIGALLHAHEAGYQIPRDFSIVGFDDIEVAKWIYPTLTTVRQPLYQIGQEAAESLVNKVEGSTESSLGKHLLLEPELMVRHSCMKLL